jgi:hypothetical protein
VDDKEEKQREREEAGTERGGCAGVEREEAGAGAERRRPVATKEKVRSSSATAWLRIFCRRTRLVLRDRARLGLRI